MVDKTIHDATGYYETALCSLSDFAILTSQTTNLERLSYATDVVENVPIYRAGDLAKTLLDLAARRALMTEWARVLQHGAGVFVIKGACPDIGAIDAATLTYEQIIRTEKADNGGGADHFAAAGSNDRVWNALQKLCEVSPEVFVRYFACPAIDAACEAWLGPNYQMTAQVNLVHPGGQAQKAHRDYHLGFQSADVSAMYPAHVHDLSPLMTLQGGIAHCDIPVESGPTKLLPFSQIYRPGYAAWRRDDFRDYFEQHFVQLPLEKGDAMFFNPALFHAAGENRTPDIHRMVNLLQVSSAFGRAMETVNRFTMCNAAFRAIQQAFQNGRCKGPALEAVLSAVAEGYSFPTNLDLDPPNNGLAPKTQKDLVRKAVEEGTSHEDLARELTFLAKRQSA